MHVSGKCPNVDTFACIHAALNLSLAIVLEYIFCFQHTDQLKYKVSIISGMLCYTVPKLVQHLNITAIICLGVLVNKKEM